MLFKGFLYPFNIYMPTTVGAGQHSETKQSTSWTHEYTAGAGQQYSGLPYLAFQEGPIEVVVRYLVGHVWHRRHFRLILL